MVITCKECNERNGHKCGCSVAIERAAHLMRSYHRGQYRAFEVLISEGIHIDDAVAGQVLANKRMEEDWANSVGMPSTRVPKAVSDKIHADIFGGSK